jgi:hypothetical protein
MNSNTVRVILGFLIAPAIPALLVFLVQIFFVPRWEATWAATTIALLGYLAALALGALAFLVMRQKDATDWIQVVFVGAALGLVCYILLIIPGLLQNLKIDANSSWLLLKNTVGLAIVGLLSGGLAGLAFWLIVIRR